MKTEYKIKNINVKKLVNYILLQKKQNKKTKQNK